VSVRRHTPCNLVVAMRREAILHGMTAGLIAAGVMSTARLLAHRAGLIERTVPQVLQERAAGEAGVDLPGGTAAHQLVAEVVHHVVGLTAGAALGAVTARPGAGTGVAYGLGIGLINALGLLPALRVDRVGGRAVDAVAHGVFGAVVAFAMRELAAQPTLQPLPTDVPARRRVG
jgi:hypothetical protein